MLMVSEFALSLRDLVKMWKIPDPSLLRARLMHPACVVLQTSRNLQVHWCRYSPKTVVLVSLVQLTQSLRVAQIQSWPVDILLRGSAQIFSSLRYRAL